MDSFTARETICCSRTSNVLWIIHLCRRGNGDDNFWQGGTEKGLIIGARYWGLEIPASEVSGDGMTWNYRKSDCRTSRQGTLDLNLIASHLKSGRVYVCVLRISSLIFIRTSFHLGMHKIKPACEWYFLQDHLGLILQPWSCKNCETTYVLVQCTVSTYTQESCN